MALPVDRFVTPEQDFAGLQQVGDSMQRNRLLEERKQENLREEEKERVGKTAASMRYFANYLDPKDRYTGTYYDPKMNEYLGTALGQAYDLAKKGAGEAEILTAISPLVNKANDYQQKAKMYSENKKQFLSAIKGQKGYNVENIARLLDQEMFEGKDIDKVDPTDMGAALNNIYSKHGSEITNDEALDEFISKLPTSKVTTDIISYNARGGKQRNKAMVDMPNIFLQEEEGGQSVFVPRYDKATDFGEDIVGEFQDESGQTVEAPVRLLEQNTFDQIIKSSPAIQYRLGALVNEAIQTGKYTDGNGKPLTLNSPQAQNLARAILYDELKAKAQVQRNIVQETKPTQIRISTGGGSKSSEEQIDLREYPDTTDGGKNITSLMQGVDVTSLVTGDKFPAKDVVYYPGTQKVKFTNISGGTETMNLTTFLQNLKPQNPAQDIKFLKGLRTAITGEKPTQPTPQPSKKEIKRSDIPAKAKAAGYSVSEYESLLKKNGVTIKD